MTGWRNRLVAVMGLAGLWLAGCATTGHESGPPPLTISGSTATLEIAPVLLAARDHYAPGAVVTDGGIANLVDEQPVDLATHAETQALRYSVKHPDVRIILTVTEGHYRIVARRSAGITAVADLKGKRIATLAITSAGYFLARMLAEEGMDFSDIQPVRISPAEDMADALARGEVDAVAIWEPHAGNAARAIGGDAIEFPGDGVYRERFNLNTTAANLADPQKRQGIVAFVRAVITVVNAVRRDPAAAQSLVSATSAIPLDDVVRAWPTLDFPASLPADLLDVLVEEEQWLAERDGRSPRSRDMLARLIDASVYEEAVRP